MINSAEYVFMRGMHYFLGGPVWIVRRLRKCTITVRKNWLDLRSSVVILTTDSAVMAQNPKTP